MNAFAQFIIHHSAFIIFFGDRLVVGFLALNQVTEVAEFPYLSKRSGVSLHIILFDEAPMFSPNPSRSYGSSMFLLPSVVPFLPQIIINAHVFGVFAHSLVGHLIALNLISNCLPLHLSYESSPT